MTQTPSWTGDKERERQITTHGGMLSHPHPNSILGRLAKTDPKAAKELMRKVREAQDEQTQHERSLREAAAS